MEKTLRVRQGVFVSGLLCLVTFVAIGAVSVVVALSQRPVVAHAARAALGFTCFWGAMSTIAVWMLLSYVRGRLVVDERRIVRKGVLFTRSIQCDDVRRVVWKSAPAQIQLCGATTQLKINLADFEPGDRLWLVRRLQQFASEEPRQVPQEHWEGFCVRVAVPLLESCRFDPQRPAAGQVLLTRQRWASYFLPATMVTLLLGLAVAWLQRRPQVFFVAPLPMLCLWGLLHLSTPAGGIVDSRVTAEPGRPQFLKFLLLWGTFGLAGTFFIGALQLQPTQRIVVGTAAAIAWIAILLFRAAQFDRQRNQHQQERIDMALQQWAAEGDTSILFDNAARQ